MNKYIIPLLLLLSANVCLAQGSSEKFTNAVFSQVTKIDKFMTEEYADTFTLRRVETGIMQPGNEKMYALAERTLYKGNKYIFYVFADNRIQNIQLDLYKISDDGKWNFIKTVDKNTSDNYGSTTDLIGDHELYTLTPEESGDYGIQLRSDNNNRVARYGVMVWSREATSSGDGLNTYYSCTTRKTCFYNTSTKKYDDCEESEESTLFTLNANHTMFKHTTPSISSTYFVQSSKYSADDKWYEYEVLSDAGNRYTFYVPDNNSAILIFNTNVDKPYVVKFAIRRQWQNK